MKKLILSLLLVIYPIFFAFSQNMQRIFENAVSPSDTVQRLQVQSFYFANNQPKTLFYQAQLGFWEGAPCMSQPTHHNTFRFNQFNYTSVIPFNNFLDRRGCENVFGSCFWYVIRNYSISHNDQNFLIAHHRYSNILACSEELFETHITYNGGATKTPVYPGMRFMGMEIDPVNDNNVYLASTSTVYKSTDRGQTFQSILSGQNITGFVRVNPRNNSIVFLRVAGGMKISTNSGQTFTDLPVPELTDMAFASGPKVFGSSASGVLLSVDQGLTWKQISAIPNVNCIELNPDNNLIIYIGTKIGVYRSINGGATFNASPLVFNNFNSVFKISKDPGSLDTLYVAVNNGIWKVWDLLTDINSTGSEIPENFGLSQNYPNPFNPVTNIGFTIPELSQVSLKVFDINGREVAELQSGQLIAGAYNFSWDASGLPSGVYFARLYASNTRSNYSNSIKMLLTK